jgi:tetratricopeptide (TPR) repeat protein
MRRVASILLVAVGVSVHAGCAHRRPGPADRFFLHKEARRTAQKAEPPSPSLEESMAKIRHLMATARPEPKPAVKTLEETDPVLSAALKTLAAATTAENLYEVGAAYHRRGLLDRAHGYYMRALRLNPRYADAHEGVARLWRDWGLPQLGLGDAHRAIYYAPASASARNTLGTLLHAAGLRGPARDAYEMAAVLDRDAGYAFSNLCYLSFVEGKASQAIAECQRALRLDPTLAAARNNLGLTYAAIGRLDLARSEFAAAGGATRAAYNMGVVYLAEKNFSAAADEFDAARAAPRLVDAERRARDARRRAEMERRAGGDQ